MTEIIQIDRITNKIYSLRKHQVLLDKDLAELYGVETRQLVQAVKRNIKRFPDDFMFQLSGEEFKNLRSQIVSSGWEVDDIRLMHLPNKVSLCSLLS